MGKLSEKLGQVKALWNTPLKGRYLPFKEIGFFGIYTLGVSFITTAITYVVTITEIPLLYKIDAIHGYLIALIGTLLNLILQPVLGYFMEKTNTKWGKYKPYIIFSLPLVGLFGILATFIPQLGETAKVVFAYCTCVPALFLSNYIYNMYQTMPNVITPNTQERADIMTPIGLVFGFAPSVLQIIAGPIRAHFLDKEYMALRIIGIISIAIGILCCCFIIKVKERVYQIEDKNKEKISFMDSLKMLAKNKPMMIAFIALILGSLREFWKTFLGLIIRLRFADNVSTALTVSGIPMTVIGFAATIAMILLPICTRKLDKKKIIIIFALLNAISLAILAIIGIENIQIGMTSAVVLTIVFFIAAVNPTYLIIPLLLGDIADYQQYKTGKRLEGHIQTVLFTVPGLCSFGFMLLASIVQKNIGFEQKNYAELEVIPQELQAIACNWFNITIIISIVSLLLLAVIMVFYPLSKKKHEAIMAELKAKSEKEEWEENNSESPVASEQVLDVVADIVEAPVVEDVVETPAQETAPVVEENKEEKDVESLEKTKENSSSEDVQQ